MSTFKYNITFSGNKFSIESSLMQFGITTSSLDPGKKVIDFSLRGNNIAIDGDKLKALYNFMLENMVAGDKLLTVEYTFHNDTLDIDQVVLKDAPFESVTEDLHNDDEYGLVLAVRVTYN